MKLQVNGKEIELPEGTSLSTFLEGLGLHPRTVVIEYNDRILSHEHYASIILQVGDRLEIVQMTAGG